MTDDGASQEHQGFMGGRILLLPSFEFAKLVEPGQTSFDEPTCSAQAAAMGSAAFGEERLHPLFLSALRCGSES